MLFNPPFRSCTGMGGSRWSEAAKALPIETFARVVVVDSGMPRCSLNVPLPLAHHPHRPHQADHRAQPSASAHVVSGGPESGRCQRRP